MRQLTREAPFVTLALSLHAPTQELRSTIVPSAKTYHLDDLMMALDAHVADNKNRRVLVEYVMLAGVNDSDEVAHQLGALLKGRQVHLNLIPYNPTEVIIEYKKPSAERIGSFFHVLIDDVHGYNIFTTIRAEHGSDIAGACGQLAIQKGGCDSDCSTDHKHEHKHSGVCESKTQDIEDLIKQKQPSRKKGSAVASTSATATATAAASSSSSTSTPVDSKSSSPAPVLSTSAGSVDPAQSEPSQILRISLLILLIAVGLTLAYRLAS